MTWDFWSPTPRSQTLTFVRVFIPTGPGKKPGGYEPWNLGTLSSSWRMVIPRDSPKYGNTRSWPIPMLMTWKTIFHLIPSLERCDSKWPSICHVETSNGRTIEKNVVTKSETMKQRQAAFFPPVSESTVQAWTNKNREVAWIELIWIPNHTWIVIGSMKHMWKYS